MHMPKARPPVVSSDGELSIPRLREPQYSQSLERGLAVLGCFTPERRVLGIADLADELGMSHATTHRYALTLKRLGYLVQDQRRKYELTLAVSDLGLSALASTSLQVHAQPYLEELSTRTGFTVYVAVLDGPEVWVVECQRGRHRGEHLLTGALPAGALRPAYCTAVGKLLLAGLPDRAQRECLAELTLAKKRAANTITSKVALRRELVRIREENIAVADEELAVGVYEIAAAVRSESHEIVAGMGMETHSSMISLEDLVSALAPHLIATADRLSAKLGYRRADERADGRSAHMAPST
jgi:IclR family transcriptional regulator, pca regulon regulatory protein